MEKLNIADVLQSEFAGVGQHMYYKHSRRSVLKQIMKVHLKNKYVYKTTITIKRHESHFRHTCHYGVVQFFIQIRKNLKYTNCDIFFILLVTSFWPTHPPKSFCWKDWEIRTQNWMTPNKENLYDSDINYKLHFGSLVYKITIHAFWHMHSTYYTHEQGSKLKKI